MKKIAMYGLLAGVMALVSFQSLAQESPKPDANPDKNSEEEVLLERLALDEDRAPKYCRTIHEKPVAGQGATYVNSRGEEHTHRIAFVRGDVCTVEYQGSNDNVVLAYEFELTSEAKHLVRRAWAGLRGKRPHARKLWQPPKDTGFGRSSVGLGGNYSYEETEEAFTEFEHAGRKWSGSLEIESYWSDRTDRMAGKAPTRVTRTWTADNAWFTYPLKIEIEKDRETKVMFEMKECKDSTAPMLDWSDIPVPSALEEKKIHQDAIQRLAKDELIDLKYSNTTFGNVWGLHPNAKEGDWARIGNTQYVLVKLSETRGAIEARRPDSELGLVEAIEFEIKDGKAFSVISRFAGIRGNKPEPNIRHHEFQDQRPLEVKEESIKPINVAGVIWDAKLVKHIRGSLRPETEGDYKDITETYVSEHAPFGQPLIYRSYRIGKEDEAYERRLTSVGDGGEAWLDWSEWEPSERWGPPFTVDEARQFFKVGMKWRYRFEAEPEDEEPYSFEEEWTVTKITEHAVFADVVLTSDGQEDRKRVDAMDFKQWRIKFRNYPIGKTTKTTAKVGDKTVDVIRYDFKRLGADFSYTFSPDLPGMLISCADGWPWPMRETLLEFTHPDDEKDEAEKPEPKDKTPDKPDSDEAD